MTKTKRALAILAGGGQTLTQLAETLNLSTDEIRRLIGYMQLKGYIETVPLTYVLTETGDDRMNRRVTTDPKKISRQTQKRREQRQLLIDQTMLDIRRVPNSVFSLGSY